jgi:hypothetical protein
MLLMAIASPSKSLSLSDPKRTLKIAIVGISNSEILGGIPLGQETGGNAVFLLTQLPFDFLKNQSVAKNHSVAQRYFALSVTRLNLGGSVDRRAMSTISVVIVAFYLDLSIDLSCVAPALNFSELGESTGRGTTG